MDINEEKSAKSQLSIEGDHEQTATKSEETAKENDQVIITAPKNVTIENNANIAAEQVKEENPTEDNKNEEVTNKEKAGEDTKESAQGLDEEKKPSKEKFKCRPIAFLLGLPFALISLVLAFVGGIIWIFGLLIYFGQWRIYLLKMGARAPINLNAELMLTCICPCCFCVTILVEMALGLVNAPFAFFQYITDKIPF